MSREKKRHRFCGFYYFRIMMLLCIIIIMKRAVKIAFKGYAKNVGLSKPFSFNKMFEHFIKDFNDDNLFMT